MLQNQAPGERKLLGTSAVKTFDIRSLRIQGFRYQDTGSTKTRVLGYEPSNDNSEKDPEA